MPVRVMGAMIMAVAAGAIAWGLTTKSVADNTKRIEVLENESRTTQQLLIRIDERTAEIKRRMDLPQR